MYKEMVLRSAADDIVYTDFFTGVRGNYLKPSIVASGLDPDNLGSSKPSMMNFAAERPKAWRDVWGCGQGIGIIKESQSAAEVVDRLETRVSRRSLPPERTGVCVTEASSDYVVSEATSRARDRHQRR